MRQRYLPETAAIVTALDALETALAELVGDLQTEAEAEVAAEPHPRFDNDVDLQAGTADQGIIYPENAAPEHDAARTSIQEAVEVLREYLEAYAP